MLNEIAVIRNEGFPWILVGFFKKDKVNDTGLCKIKNSDIEHEAIGDEIIT